MSFRRTFALSLLNAKQRCEGCRQTVVTRPRRSAPELFRAIMQRVTTLLSFSRSLGPGPSTEQRALEDNACYVQCC